MYLSVLKRNGRALQYINEESRTRNYALLQLDKMVLHYSNVNAIQYVPDHITFDYHRIDTVPRTTAARNASIRIIPSVLLTSKNVAA